MHFDYALVERWFEKTQLNIARRQLITKDRYDRTVNNFFPEELSPLLKDIPLEE